MDLPLSEATLSAGQTASAGEAARPTVSIVVVGWRNAPLLPKCLQSIETIDCSISHEVIFTLNEPTSELLATLSGSSLDIQVVPSRVNRGFGGACNAGASLARGRYIVFLNDDTLVDRMWLRELVDTAEVRPEIGAVGSLCLNMDGSAQEAGSFLWSDGSTSCATGGEPAFFHRYDWARQVDYCSAASLLVKKSTWDQVGGFDEEYYPAYYEDVDLCLKIKEIGQEVWFQPFSVVRHIQSASTTNQYKTFLMLRNRRLLSKRWPHVLEQQVRPGGDKVGEEEVANWITMGRPPRILVIDDRIPEASNGAGFGRMVDALSELTSAGSYFVSFFPTSVSDGNRDALRRMGVRVIHDDLEAHLRQTGVDYDLVMISRPHNYGLFGKLVRECQPQAAVIYDAEALYFRRTELQAQLTNDGSTNDLLLAEANTMRQNEQEFFADADHAVCISDTEAEFARSIRGAAQVHVIPAHLVGPSCTARPFDQRRDVVFVASWLAGARSPNGDGLTWLVEEVLPLVHARIPWVRIRVSGANPPEEMLRFESPNVQFEGRVRDLGDFYDEARVAIAPIRYGAGVKLKTIEALQYGVPIVSTTVGAEGIEALGTGALCVADDPHGFADRVTALVDDRGVWEAQRSEISDLHRRWAARSPGTSWLAVVDQALRDRDTDAPARLIVGIKPCVSPG